MGYDIKMIRGWWSVGVIGSDLRKYSDTESDRLPRPITAKVNCLRQRHVITLDMDGVKMHNHSDGEVESILAMDALASAFGTPSVLRGKASECRCQEIKTLSLAFLRGKYVQDAHQSEWKRLPKTFREEIPNRLRVGRRRRSAFDSTSPDNLDKLGTPHGNYWEKNRSTAFGNNLNRYSGMLESIKNNNWRSSAMGFRAMYANPYAVWERGALGETPIHHDSHVRVRVMRRLVPNSGAFERKEPHSVLFMCAAVHYVGIATWQKVPVRPLTYTEGMRGMTKSQASAWRRRYAEGQLVWGWKLSVQKEVEDA